MVMGSFFVSSWS